MNHNQLIMDKNGKNNDYLNLDDDDLDFGENKEDFSEVNPSKKEDINVDADEEQDSSKNYWTNITEKAVIDFLYLNEMFYDNRIKEEENLAVKEKRDVNRAYCAEMEKRKQETLLILDRKTQRDKIFREHIEIPLKKLVENILFNYRLFIPGIDIKTQESDCFTFLYMKFTNFNPWQKTKSFSYYGTVAKHYYLGNRKDFSKEVKIIANFDTSKEEVETMFWEENDIYKPKDKTLDLFNHVIQTIENDLEKGVLTKNDQKVGDAIVQIFKNHEIMGVYNKNQIYQLVKDFTGLETKDITYSLHRFRVSYKVLRQDFNDKDR